MIIEENRGGVNGVDIKANMVVIRTKVLLFIIELYSHDLVGWFAIISSIGEAKTLPITYFRDCEIRSNEKSKVLTVIPRCVSIMSMTKVELNEPDLITKPRIDRFFFLYILQYKIEQNLWIKASLSLGQ